MGRNIAIGILSEGISDVSSLGIICNRLLLDRHQIEVSISNDLSKPTKGPISEKAIKIRTALFKEGEIDLAFYFADADKQGHNEKLNFIRNAICAYDSTWLDRAVIGVPDRNLEAWLLADQDTVKRVLDISASSPLPHDRISDPKERLLHLVSEYGNDALTPSVLRLKMAKIANLEKIERQSNSFRAFCDELSSKVARFK